MAVRSENYWLDLRLKGQMSMRMVMLKMLISMMAMQALKFYGNNHFLPATTLLIKHL